jgi:hypothetical protein
MLVTPYITEGSKVLVKKVSTHFSNSVVDSIFCGHGSLWDAWRSVGDAGQMSIKASSMKPHLTHGPSLSTLTHAPLESISAG